jgi:hypothetical protein
MREYLTNRGKREFRRQLRLRYSKLRPYIRLHAEMAIALGKNYCDPFPWTVQNSHFGRLAGWMAGMTDREARHILKSKDRLAAKVAEAILIGL